MLFVSRVFLPFGLGYFLSSLFRVINALIASRLSHDLGLGAAGLGTMTSVFFLAFAASQLVVGRLLDRFGPRRVQAGLLLIAAGGIALFATAHSFWLLTLARAILAVGFSAGLASAIKVIVTWLPKKRISLANGWMFALGALGAISATAPSDVILDWVGWRGLLGLLAVLTLGASGLIYATVPDKRPTVRPGSPPSKMPMRQIYRSRDFLQIAPLASLAISVPWAMQALWAARWMADVDGYDHRTIVGVLFVMGCTLCAGGALFGSVTDRLHAYGVATETVFAVAVAALGVVEILILAGAPLPAVILWGALSLFGALPALGFAIMGERFPAEVMGQISSAYVMLNFLTVFLVQAGMGYILALWPHAPGAPASRIGFDAALAAPCVLQLLAFAWFFWCGASRRRALQPAALKVIPSISEP